MTAALLCLLLAAAPGPASEVAGELCLFRADRTLPVCSATAGRKFRVERSDASHFAVWRSREGTEAAVGPLEREAETIDLQSEAWQPVAVEVRGAAGGFAVRWRGDGAESAGFAAALRNAVSLRRLWLPARDGEVTFEAEHHESVVRAVKRGTTSLGVIALKALPLLTGTVVAAEDQGPLPFAIIALPSGATAATADSTGRFRLRIAGEWPDFLRVTAAGRAAADVDVPKIVADADLGVIRLGAGGTLRVRTGDRPPLEVRLLRRAGGALREVAVRPEVSGSADFERLESGRYVVLLRGTGPLQQLALPAEVRDGETTAIEARIEPAELSLAVRRRNEGVPASITLKPASGEWQTAITTGEDGRYEGEIWQRGEFVSFITAGDTTAARHDRLEGAREIEWTIDLPHLRIAGTVTDSAGKPIAGAEVMLETVSGDTGTQTAETTDAAGRFTFRGVEAGGQTLTATAEGYLPSTSSFPLTESDYTATIRLRRGVRRTLVVTRQGQPAANATVVDEVGSAEQRTDARGTVALTIGAGEQKTFYILPLEGSFAVVDVNGREPGEVRVDVPAPAATIRIMAVSSENEPIQGMFFALRLNGRMLTPWVRAVLRSRRGTPLETGADGVATLTAMPLGVYELWPYFRPAELTQIEGGLVPPRARIAAQPGLNEVRFTFDEE